MEDLNKLLIEMLRDAHSAEKQGVRAMPRLAKKAQSQALKDALQAHAEETETQIERLEQALEQLGGKPGRKVCEAMRGIIEEAQHELGDQEKGPVYDMLLTAAIQKVEHYEIATYGTLATLAKSAGQKELGDLLGQTLTEEKKTDELLTQLAEREINGAAIQAMQQPEAANEPRGSSKKSA
ncbi:YciE/YciF ferroxidase family protein [Paracraurococcus lichenis]|uniref:Ferritin-like domain-containing protein n=1 Tax=Paracraurococcus lichenis TaxID=3064888 RepID=A0ABT9DSZ4_9PROT|nr:ferritin-like domain-containing protein [Paracraurococcus sp. LOR1-02]MDO9707015.1 ferritin-like domain-containing protein [Paracraurococcus sp. LOR1-02]